MARRLLTPFVCSRGDGETAGPASHAAPARSGLAETKIRTRGRVILVPDPVILVLVLIIQTMLAGCHGPEDTASAWGVKSPGAPNEINEMLLQWGGFSPPATKQIKWTAELADALTRDTDEVVDLCEYSLTDEVRATVSGLRRVRWLRLPIEAIPADLRWVGEMRQLRGISLGDTDMTGANFQILGELKELQWLNLSCIRMATGDFRTLPRLKSLQVLFLGGNLVTDEYLFHLAELRLPSLITLSLADTNVTDVGIERICSVYELEDLDLAQSPRVTKESVKSIARMRTLRVLGIGGTGICPDYHMNDSIRELERRLPRTRVDYGD